MGTEKMSIKEGLRWGACFAAAFVTTVVTATQDDWLIALRAYSLLHLIQMVMLCILYKKALGAFAGRRAVFATALGAVLALCMSLGRIFTLGYDFGNVPVLFLGYLPLFIACFSLLLALLDARKSLPLGHAGRKPRGKVLGFFHNLLDGSRRHTLLVWGMAALCWLPCLLVFYPGVVNDDVITQFYQWFGSLEAHHPPLHTIWIGVCSRLGVALFGDAGAGLAVMAFLQLVAQAGVFALVIQYMARMGLSFGWRLGAALYYVLFPAFGRYSVTLVKDVWLGHFLLLFLLLLVDIVRRRAQFFHSGPRVAALGGVTAMLLLSKNNALYIFAIGVVCCILVLKGCRRQLLVLLALGIGFSMLITGPVYRALGIVPPPVEEALSIPLQQLGRVALVDARIGNIPQEERDIINEILPYDELAERYDYMISDPVKTTFNREAFRQDPGRYMALWVRLGLRFPSTYARAFLEQSMGYWYPDATGGLYMTKTYYQYMLDTGRDPQQDVMPWDGLTRAITGLIGVERNVPGFGLLYKPGFNFWVLLFCGAWLLYKKQYGRLAPLGLLLGVWLTCVASPLYAEFRYAWPAIICVPFFLACTFGESMGEKASEARLRQKVRERTKPPVSASQKTNTIQH